MDAAKGREVTIITLQCKVIAITRLSRRAVLFCRIGFGNAATAAWLSAMFLTLRHEAFARNAGAAAALALCCAAAPFATSARAPVWARAAVTGFSLLLAGGGALVLLAAVQRRSEVEGFALVIAVGWLAQGVTAIPAMRTRWRRAGR
jgi:hypothetical protein